MAFAVLFMMDAFLCMPESPGFLEASNPRLATRKTGWSPPFERFDYNDIKQSRSHGEGNPDLARSSMMCPYGSG
jgi:hypothetical protein